MVIVVFVDRLIKMTHFAAVLYSSNDEDYSAAVYQSACTKVSCASAYATSTDFTLLLGISMLSVFYSISEVHGPDLIIQA